MCWMTNRTRLGEGAHHDSTSSMSYVHVLVTVITLHRCLGIQCNIWGRARDSTQLVHRLRGGGQHLTGYRALMWQSLLSADTEGVLGVYEPLIWLPRKAAIFLFEYHDHDFRGKVPGLPALPAPQDRDQYLDVDVMLNKEQLRGLMSTWSIRQAMKDRGHFRLFGTLAIGHAVHPGFQRVQCWPFPKVQFYGANRQDYIIVRPPGAAAQGFVPTIARHCSYSTWKPKRTAGQKSINVLTSPFWSSLNRDYLTSTLICGGADRESSTNMIPM